MKACAPIISQPGPVVLYNRGQFVGCLPGPAKRRASFFRAARRGALGRSVFGFAAALLPVFGIWALAFIYARALSCSETLFMGLSKRCIPTGAGPLIHHKARSSAPWHLRRRGCLILSPPAARRGADPLNQRKKARPNLDRPFLLGFIRSALLLASSGPSVRPFWSLPFVLPSFPGIRPRVPPRCRCGSMRPSRCRATPAQK